MRFVFFRYFCRGISPQSLPRRDSIALPKPKLQVGPFDGRCQRRLASPSSPPCAPRSSVLAPFADPMRPCRRPGRLSRRLEREESPEAMLTRRSGTLNNADLEIQPQIKFAKYIHIHSDSFQIHAKYTQARARPAGPRARASERCWLLGAVGGRSRARSRAREDRKKNKPVDY